MTIKEKLIEHVQAMSEAEAERWYRQMEEGFGSPSYREVIKRHLKELGSESFGDLPTDLASQHDHYAYGTPKK